MISHRKPNEWDRLQELNNKQMNKRPVGARVRLTVCGGMFTGVIVEHEALPIELLSPRYKVRLDSGELTGWLYKSEFTLTSN